MLSYSVKTSNYMNWTTYLYLVFGTNLHFRHPKLHYTTIISLENKNRFSMKTYCLVFSTPDVNNTESIELQMFIPQTY